MPTMYLIRGIPGSGKSTKAQILTEHVFEADQFFMVGGIYQWHRDDLYLAHRDCQHRVASACRRKLSPVAVANTFVDPKDMKPYRKIAETFCYEVIVIDLFDAGLTDEELCVRNLHGVPIETIARMRQNWKVIP